MVVFTCNNCGESLKKQAVDKHYMTKCRGTPKNVSCMDCQKDFYNEEFVKHIKCISEVEKYSGKDYVHKEPANSNGKKQESWMDIVHSILDNKDYQMDEKTRSAFERLQNMDNVPRKKAKFINYANNCLKMYKPIVDKVWNILERELEQMKKARAAETERIKAEQLAAKEAKAKAEAAATPEEAPPKKKKKKNKENIDSNGATESNDTQTNGKVSEAEEVESQKKKAKKSKTKSEESEEPEVQETNTEASADSDEFQWSSVIERLVAKHPDGIPLTKLQKKLLKKYLAKMALEALDEKQQKKFEKKFSKNLKKSPAVQLEGELVKPC